MTKKDAFPDIKDLSFEEALKQLEAIVRKLESGALNLEQSIEDYSRGAALKAHCERKLTEAKLKVEKIMLKESGDVALEPLDAE